MPFDEWLPLASPGWPWHYDHIQRAILPALEAVTNGETRKLMLFLPPRHFKSETVTVRYSAYRILSDPSLRVIVGAYNQTLAEKFSRKARRIVREHIPLNTERTAVDDWETTMGGGLQAKGVGAGVTGTGGSLIVIDDPVKSREEAESAAYRDRVYRWYTDDLYTRQEKSEDGEASFILIQTRWHADDLAGRILASEDAPNWTVISLPAEAEDNDPLGRALGQPLCPAILDAEGLADRRTVLGSYGYTSLYQQRPSPAEGGMVKRSWFRYYEERPQQFEQIIQSWDMAFKDTDTSDYVVGQVWGLVGANCYLLDQHRDRMDFPTTIQAVTAMSEKWPEARAKLVEDKANGTAVIQTLSNRISGLIPVEPHGGKGSRLAAVSPVIESGNVYLPVPLAHQWVQDFIEEVVSFPNAAKDDQVDAMTQALMRLTTVSQGVF